MTDKAAINIYVLAIACTYTLLLLRECRRVEYGNHKVDFYFTILRKCQTKGSRVYLSGRELA